MNFSFQNPSDNMEQLLTNRGNNSQFTKLEQSRGGLSLFQNDMMPETQNSNSQSRGFGWGKIS